MGPEQIQKLIEGMDKECKAIKKNAWRQGWYSRGALSYEDALNLSADERDMVNEIIDENLETTKKSQLPFF
jgi:hypothetical protein